MSRLGVVTLLLLLLFSSVSVQAERAPAPTGLRVSGTTSTTISLTWSAPADDGNGAIQGYYVYRCEEGQAPCTPASKVWLAGAITSYTRERLTTGQEYRFAVSCRRGHGTESVWSNQVTSAAEPLPQAPAPTGLRVSGTTATTITLAWTASADDGYGKMDGYNVTGGFDDEAEGHLFSWVAVPRHIAQESHTQRNLIEGRTYRFKVQAARDTVSTAPTSWVYATAGMPPSPIVPIVPIVPKVTGSEATAVSADSIVLKVTGLKATAASADSISLSWKPSVKDVMKAYSVYRCTVPQGESTCDPYDGLWLANLENTNAYTDTEVTPGETYRYAVAVEPFRRGELSGAITVVAQMPQMLAAPNGLMVTEVDESSVRLRWTAPEDDGRGPVGSIDIYRCNVDRSPDCSEFLYLTSRNPALTEYKDNDVESDTTYRYAVAAYRSDDEVSPWSNQVTATAEGEPGPAPDGAGGCRRARL